MVEVKVKDRPKAKPSGPGNSKKLLVHIVPRDDEGNMTDKTLCGEMWDKPLEQSNNICPECKRIARENNLNALRKP